MGLFEGFGDKARKFSDLNKYVNDFEITEEKDEKGRVRKTARYTGLWTVIRDPSPAVLSRIWAAAGVSVLLLVIYIRMLLLNHAAGGQLFVMLPLLAGLFPGLYLMMGALSLPFRGKPMRRDQYMHSFIRASRSAVAVAAFVFAGFAASMVYRIIRSDWLFLPEDWVFLAGCALILALCGGIVIVLRSVDLAEKENAAYESKPL